MEMIERIKELCRQKGTNLSNLERELGFSNGSIAKSDEKIQSVRLKAIAEYFGVNMEYLLDGKGDYYINPETAQKAQELFENPDMRILFDAARDSSPDDLQMAADLLSRLKGTNPNG